MASMNLLVCVFVGSFLYVAGARPEEFGKAHYTHCHGAGTAKYEVEFYGEWSQRAFPRQYPIFRPNAQWSALLGAMHNSGYQMWDNGSMATEAFKGFVEKASSSLQTELILSKDVHISFAAPALMEGVGITTAKDITVSEEYPLMSLVARIHPSPDWFVGIHDVNLCNDGNWIDELTFDLYPWDAGTDQGFMFTSPNYPNDPPEPIYQITSHNPDFFASSFYYENMKHLPRMAYVKIKKVANAAPPSWLDQLLDTSMGLAKVFDFEEAQLKKDFINLEMSDSGNGIPTVHTDNETSEESGETAGEPSGAGVLTPLNCLVGEWGGWAPCDKICKLGLKRRYRVVMQRPKNGGEECPDLINIQKCHSGKKFPERLACAERRIQKETRKYMKREQRHWAMRSKNKYTVLRK